MPQCKFWAVVPAAGIGQRMQADRPKQYLPLLGATVLEATISRLLEVDIFAAIVVAIATQDQHWRTLACSTNAKVISAKGGKQRADSVLSALQSLAGKAQDNDWVLVHDAARPCIRCADILRLVAASKNSQVGGILAAPASDTLKNISHGQIKHTIDRSQVWRALTPQMFRYTTLKKALQQTSGNPDITDESCAVEQLGLHPLVVQGSVDNIKITRHEDLALANFYLQQQEGQ